MCVSLYISLTTRHFYHIIMIMIIMTNPAIRQSGNPAIRQSGNPAIRQSGNPAIRQSGNYEQLILFVKPFCFFKICKTIGFVLISYKHTIQILQTIFSAISSLYFRFVAYAASVKAFLISFGFYGKLFCCAKNACRHRRHAGTVLCRAGTVFP